MYMYYVDEYKNCTLNNKIDFIKQDYYILTMSIPINICR